MNKDVRREALDRALLAIEKEFGKGAIMKMGESKAVLEVTTIPSGSLALDIALGVGGIPKGRVVEIFGPEASGKTTLALSIMAEAQKRGGICAFVDAENAFDPVYAQNLGIKVDDLLISQPDTGEQALEICDHLIRSGAVDVIAVDSVAALVPRMELEGEMGEAYVGLQARLMSQALRKLSGSIHKSQTVAIFVNQMRQRVGVMMGQNPETTTGGLALKFYASIRLDIRRKEPIRSGEAIIGNRVTVKVVKNKLAPPFRTAEFDILFGKGIWKAGDLLDVASTAGIIQKSGAWFSFEDKKLGQGKQQAAEFLESHPEVADEIEKKVRQHYHLPSGGTEP
ncbi:MAG: recombinase RecA [bacterium JZ-2024 1]